MDLIDLRSDTVTRPSTAMRQAMATASVGDDQHGECPTTNALQEKIARLIATRIAQAPGVLLDIATVQSNIVIFRTAPGAPDAATIVSRAREGGVLVSAFAARTVRVTTHLDVDEAACARAGDILAAIMQG